MIPNIFTNATVGNYYLFGIEKAVFWLTVLAAVALMGAVMYLANLPQPVPSWAAEGRRRTHRRHR